MLHSTQVGYRRYVAQYLSVLLAILLIVSSINVLVDPLWHFKGNQITGVNLPLNERTAKVNLFLKNPKKYDCLIFGSSKTTMLPASKISQHTCINLSFSAGNINEFITYAQYIESLGFLPKMIYVGVDEYNFFSSLENNVPHFVKSRTLPRPIYQDIFSLDVFYFSLRTLLNGLNPRPRYYNASFEGTFHKPIKEYHPRKKLSPRSQSFNPDVAKRYGEFKKSFPTATVVGYVPPLSVWHVTERLYLSGYMSDYLKAMTQVASSFDALYDFSVPSQITTVADETYDGVHYSYSVNEKVVDVLQGRCQYGNFGINVEPGNVEEYKEGYAHLL